MMKKHAALVVGAPDEGGTLAISESVLEEIAYTEAMATEGVVPPRGTVMQGVLGRRGGRGVRVDVSGQDVAFHLTFGVRCGVRIPDVATTVRRRIASALHEKTGYTARVVNVLVDHVAFESSSSEEG